MSDVARRLWASLRAQSTGVQAAVWICALPVALVLWSLSRRRARAVSGVLGCGAALVVLALPLGIGGSDPGVEVVADDPAPTTDVAPTSAPTSAPTTAPEPAPTSTEAPIAPVAPTVPAAPPTSPAMPDRRSLAETLLASVSVAPEADGSGYDRELFQHWIDTDRDGCNTRCEVLERQQLPNGTWFSTYDRVAVANSSDLDVDHVVPLAEAWRSGASAWDPSRRRDFANDLGDHALVAVTASSNRSKGDRDPAQWRPSHPDDHCAYAVAWLTVKQRWGLSADPSEFTALQHMVSTC